MRRLYSGGGIVLLPPPTTFSHLLLIILLFLPGASEKMALELRAWMALSGDMLQCPVFWLKTTPALLHVR